MGLLPDDVTKVKARTYNYECTQYGGNWLFEGKLLDSDDIDDMLRKIHKDSSHGDGKLLIYMIVAANLGDDIFFSDFITIATRVIPNFTTISDSSWNRVCKGLFDDRDVVGKYIQVGTPFKGIYPLKWVASLPETMEIFKTLVSKSSKVRTVHEKK